LKVLSDRGTQTNNNAGKASQIFGPRNERDDFPCSSLSMLLLLKRLFCMVTIVLLLQGKILETVLDNSLFLTLNISIAKVKT